MGKKRDVSMESLDKLWAAAIRLQYMFLCAVCRKEGHDAHHIIARHDKRHRWHPLNGVLLCSECHTKAHAKPKLFRKWLRRNLRAVHEHVSRPNDNGYDPRDRLEIKRGLKGITGLLERNLENGPTINRNKKGHVENPIVTLFSLLGIILLAAVAVTITLLSRH